MCVRVKVIDYFTVDYFLINQLIVCFIKILKMIQNVEKNVQKLNS